MNAATFRWRAILAGPGLAVVGIRRGGVLVRSPVMLSRAGRHRAQFRHPRVDEPAAGCPTPRPPSWPVAASGVRRAFTTR